MNNLFDLKEVIARFPVPAGELSINNLGGGLINSTWRVDVEGESFVLQKINEAVFKDPNLIAFNLKLLSNHLKKNNSNYYFVSSVPTVSGDDIVKIDNQGTFRLLPFVKNTHTINTVSSESQAYEAAKQFGLFTRHFSDFDSSVLKPTIPDFHNLNFRFREFQRATTSADQAKIKRAAKEIEAVRHFNYFVDDYDSIVRKNTYKLRVTHHDTKISNVLFDSKDEGVCVIDLDTVMPGYFFSDVGDMVRTYVSTCNEEETDMSKLHVRPEFYKAVVHGYLEQTHILLEKQEIDGFFESSLYLTYMQAIRFLTDYLMNDYYYGSKFEGQNLFRAQNQLCLLKELLNHEKEFRKIIKSFH